MSPVRWDLAPQRIVGIGASAGGLDALKPLIAGLPRDSGLSFVVLQQLPPAQTATLAALLGPLSPLPVRDAGPRHQLEPNTIVVVPPYVGAEIHDGAIELCPISDGGSHHP